jgi:hypothetical protein
LAIYFQFVWLLLITLCCDRSRLLSQVSKPRLGELIPRSVDCTVTVDLSRFSGDMRSEWEGFREHDVVFLLCIDHPQADAAAQLAEFEKSRRDSTAPLSQGEELNFAKLFGIRHVRGGELFELRDEANVVLNDPSRYRFVLFKLSFFCGVVAVK